MAHALTLAMLNQANRNAIGSLIELGVLEPYSDEPYDSLYWNRRVFQIIAV